MRGAGLVQVNYSNGTLSGLSTLTDVVTESGVEVHLFPFTKSVVLW